MKMKVKMRQVFGILLSLVLVLGLMPGINVTVEASGSIYYKEWNGGRKTVVNVAEPCTNYTAVESTTSTWSSGWYVVDSDVSIDTRIQVSGDVNLILCDGKTLTAEKGISVPNAATLHIYEGNTTNTIEGTGALNASAPVWDGHSDYVSFVFQPGIGDMNNCGTIAIDGGIITAKGGSKEASGAPGIGGQSSGEVIIHGGMVNAIGSAGQKGIRCNFKVALGVNVYTSYMTIDDVTEMTAVTMGTMDENGLKDVTGERYRYVKTVYNEPTSFTNPEVSGNDRVYDGTEQALLTVNLSTLVAGGSMRYVLGTDDTTVPTSGWSEAIPMAKEIGTYYVWYKVLGDSEHLDSEPGCVKVTIRKAESSDNTSDSGSTDTTDTASKVPYEDVPIASGYVKDITGTAAATAESNPFETKIKNNSELKTLLSLTDAEVAEGVNVWLDIQDIGSSVSKTDKSLVQNASDDYTVGMYLDINLFKKVGSNAATKITETNGKIKASILIPKSLRKSGRTLALIRVHDGVAKVIAGTYDEDTHIFTFETDKFSTYAIAYKDAASSTESESSDSSSSTGSTSTGSTSTGSATTTATAPKTGDANDMRLLCLLVLVVFAGVGFFDFSRRKRVNK